MQREDIKDLIQQSDMVVVGIGEEFGLSPKMLPQKYLDKINGISSEQLQQALLRKVYQREPVQELIKGYHSLLQLVQDKNYFIVSLNQDGILQRVPFKEERCVFPCGGYEKLQCPDSCCNTLEELDAQIEEWSEKVLDSEEGIPLPATMKCKQCGKELIFNNIYADIYNESGYLEQWDMYRKWLQGTLNKTVCLLELGVGLQFPSVIRWPFEKMCYLNKKARLIRVHSTLYQLAEEVEGKGIAVKANPVHFLNSEYM